MFLLRVRVRRLVHSSLESHESREVGWPLPLMYKDASNPPGFSFRVPLKYQMRIVQEEKASCVKDSMLPYFHRERV